MRERNVPVLFHYIPLHSAPAGQRFGRVGSDLSVTSSTGDTLLRLPLYVGIPVEDIDYVVESMAEFYGLAGRSHGASVAAKANS